MAQKAKKDLARANAQSLKTLHLVSLALNTTFLISSLVFRSAHSRPSLNLYLALSLPAFICELILERTGRPRRDPATGALRSPGDDLAAPGLTEYLFDVVWVTWACVVLAMLFGDRAWWLWAVVPAFGVWKGWGLLAAARTMVGLGGLPGVGGIQGPPAEGTAQANRRRRRAA